MLCNIVISSSFGVRMFSNRKSGDIRVPIQRLPSQSQSLQCCLPFDSSFESFTGGHRNKLGFAPKFASLVVVLEKIKLYDGLAVINIK